jgi:hypothetical protein
MKLLKWLSQMSFPHFNFPTPTLMKACQRSGVFSAVICLYLLSPPLPANGQMDRDLLGPDCIYELNAEDYSIGYDSSSTLTFEEVSGSDTQKFFVQANDSLREMDTRCKAGTFVIAQLTGLN